MPVLASLVLRARATEREPLVMRLATWAYAPALRLVLRHRLAVVIFTVAMVVVSVVAFRGLGAEFVPRLSEGAIAIYLIRLPGTS